MTYSTFRSIWPILEKKQEAEFRKTVFNWYKEIQTQFKDRLSIVNVSLFLTPGGSRFLNFMLEFSQFILLEQITSLKRKQDTADLRPILTKPSDFHPTGVAVFKAMIQANVQEIAKHEQDLDKAKVEAKAFVEESSDRCRQLRAEIAKIDAKYEIALAKARSEQRDRNNNPEDNLEDNDDLEKECAELKSATEFLRKEANGYMVQNQASLSSMDSILGSASGLSLIHI